MSDPTADRYDRSTDHERPLPMTSTSRRSPTLRRRRLSAEIRRLRHEANMTATHVGKTLGWSQGKLTGMELGEWIRPNPRDIEDLCGLYGVDAAKRAELVELAKGAKEKDGWWHPYRKQIGPDYAEYIGFENGASELYAFEPLMIHGLLQTEDYARALIAADAAELSPDQVEERVEIRAKRQQLLTGPDPLRLWVVLHEAALRTLVGNADVMTEQLRYLLRMAGLAKVTMQVVPFNAGAHSGVTGGFSILSFPEPEDPGAVYIDNPAGQHFIEQPEEVKRFKVAFQRLQARALSIEDSLRMIGDMAS
jgi:transcriptional regulator with XRE-family HTH domain